MVELLAADPRRLQALYLDAERAGAPEIRTLKEDAQSAGVLVQELPAETLAGLCRGAVHQGVAAHVAKFPYVELEDLLRDSKPLLLVLDGVQDPQNVGAAARACWALGGTGLVLPKDRSASITAASEKVASGALAHLRVAQVTNLARALEQLKRKGVWVIGLDVSGKGPVWEQEFNQPVALVVGGEHEGMRQLTRKMCDHVVSVPMAHPKAALNAADAAAVALYEASRQRAQRHPAGG